MTDPRPRPKYGEYAPLPPTAPEGKSEVDAGESATDPAAMAPPIMPIIPDSSLNAQHQRGAAAGLTGHGANAEAPARKHRLWDVFLTATLLLFGVADIINTFSTVANLGPVLREGLAAQGMDDFSSDAIATDAGGVANIVRIAALVLTIIFALLQIQRKRIAFWIPLIGASVAGLALMVAIFVAVLSDPGFMAYVESLQ
ncbi:hypothetical protein I6E68_10620 [Salinibacterium sp. NSLL150]|uniref:DUF6264 family protein n=1 Tax=unclassified Salinibacterium TaxID=2632331 RepID=UPI0018CCD2C6|nr:MULTISPECIES: DUF6264 family protein [unclassified Salinibacterium]MBH0099589.1 hypothetical protein [Salinibacterium sp. NSLL35]MBH0102343.1 hypothetical protein [Salinibacterium sp. NSLL150]MBH0105103.1 hypothetical protein [Salinibacterium sp. NSLL16]MBH0107863.1 hypothetical protein [Salinibacterium sp. NSLL17]